MRIAIREKISGGEQQRAALARALAIEPEALLLDEPLSALDTLLRSQMEAQLQETFAAYRRPALVVTHNMEEAYRLAAQLLVLIRGRVAAFGAKDEIFRFPPSLEVARLTGCKNFSRVRAISETAVEALDWNCNLQVTRPIARPPGYVGIRAHHIEFVDAAALRKGKARIHSPAGSRNRLRRPFASRPNCIFTARPATPPNTIYRPKSSRKSGKPFAPAHFPGTCGFRPIRSFFFRNNHSFEGTFKRARMGTKIGAYLKCLTHLISKPFVPLMSRRNTTDKSRFTAYSTWIN